MKVAFYKYQYGTFLDKTIAYLTWGPYSHCELVFYDGMSFSSSPRDGGTRFKEIDYSTGYWDLVDVESTIKREELCRIFCESEAGKPYDYFGAIRLRGDRQKWFCSEICIAALGFVNPKVFLYFDRGWSPNRFYKELMRL